MDSDKTTEVENIRLSMLRGVFSSEPVKHNNKTGQVYWSGTKNSNPDCLKNRVAQILEP